MPSILLEVFQDELGIQMTGMDKYAKLAKFYNASLDYIT